MFGKHVSDLLVICNNFHIFDKDLYPLFQRAHWSDMFTGRLKSEIPQALVRYVF